MKWTSSSSCADVLRVMVNNMPNIDPPLYLVLLKKSYNERFSSHNAYAIFLTFVLRIFSPSCHQ